jgi:hypothetical protein
VVEDGTVIPVTHARSVRVRLRVKKIIRLMRAHYWFLALCRVPEILGKSRNTLGKAHSAKPVMVCLIFTDGQHLAKRLLPSAVF